MGSRLYQGNTFTSFGGKYFQGNVFTRVGKKGSGGGGGGGGEEPTGENVRLGVMVSSYDLATWRSRISTDKVYNTYRDYAYLNPDGTRKMNGGSPYTQNTPADWARIVDYANQFNNNPTNYRWGGSIYHEDSIYNSGHRRQFNGVYFPNAWTKSDHGAYTESGLEPHTTARAREFMYSAAFYVMVNWPNMTDSDINTRLTNIKNELYWHATQANLRFGTHGSNYQVQIGTNSQGQPIYETRNNSIIPTGVYNDVNPGFIVANWMLQKLYSLDFVDIMETERNQIRVANGQAPLASIFSTTERNAVNQWFIEFGNWATDSVNHTVDGAFTDRTTKGEDEAYTIKNDGNNWNNDADYIYRTATNANPAEARTKRITLVFNNRRLAMYRAGAAVGSKYNIQSLLDKGRRFGKDMIKYGMHRNGAITELERNSPSGAGTEQGYQYGIVTLASLLHLAHILALRGDSSLRTFKTIHGDAYTATTVGNEKSIDKAMDFIYQLKTQTTVIYAHGATVSTDNIIDGKYPQNANVSTSAGSNRRCYDLDTAIAAMGSVICDSTAIKQKCDQMAHRYIATNQSAFEVQAPCPYSEPSNSLRSTNQGRHWNPTPDWGSILASHFMFGSRSDFVYPS